MKSIFKTVIALCIMLTIVTAAEAKSTKKEISAFVTEHLNATAEYCENRMPLATVYTLQEMWSVYEYLNEKSQKHFDKTLAKWCMKHKKEYALIIKYGNAAMTINNETGINDYDPAIIIFVFHDAIYESAFYENSDICTLVILDQTIYRMQHPNSEMLEEYAAIWARETPNRSEIVAQAMQDNFDAVLECMMNYFGEDYASMSEEELTACYVNHYKQAALEKSRQETMMAQRHIIIANTIAKEYTINEDVVQEEFDKWYNEDYEMASLVISVE